MKKFVFWCLMGAAVLSGPSACVKEGIEPGGEDVRSRIAEAYGIESFGVIDKLQFTFNRQEDERSTRRFWIWEPAANRVTFKSDGHQPAVTYARKELDKSSPAPVKQVDRWFLHDSYWLLLPFRLAWDHHAEIADVGLCESPLKGESARCVNVVYPPTIEGHIIGDVYKLYLNGEYRIMESVYQPEDASRRPQTMLWAKHRRVGPIVLSLERLDGEGRAAVRFTGVGVEVGGTWLWAD